MPQFDNPLSFLLRMVAPDLYAKMEPAPKPDASMLSGYLTQPGAPTAPVTLASRWPSADTLKPYNPSMADRFKGGVQDALIFGGANPYYAGKLGGFARDVVGMTGAWLPNEINRATEAGDLPGAALAATGAIPGAGPIGKAAAKAAKAARVTMAGLPSIRDPALSAAEAIKIARRQGGRSHLIPAPAGSEGAFVGGPRNVKSFDDLKKIREGLDASLAREPRGHDWYERYRAWVNEVTGGNPVDATWLANQHRQWSAGVSPEAELQFALKENNSALAGMPEKSGRPLPHQRHLEAIATKDPERYLSGKKTSTYGRLINPWVARPTVVGTNDFRHGQRLGYTAPGGKPFTGAGISKTQSTFMDFETALAVDRANRKAIGGRTDWTGEAVQSAPWVEHKALDLMKRNKKLTYEEAIARANTTPADFADKHTAFGTHEAYVGSDTGHLPKSVGADSDVRDAFTAEPESSWAFAPGGRDAIYSGLRIEGTGDAMRVRPSVEMQGIYTPEGQPTEYNRGWTARPLVSFKSGKTKSLPAYEHAILNAGESTRAYVDAQNAGSYHKIWTDGPLKDRNSLFVPFGRKLTRQEAYDLREVGAKYGIGDVADTGRGVTITDFANGPPPINKKSGLFNDIERVLGVKPLRVKVDPGYVPYSDAWKAGVGSGEATRQLLKDVSVTPELRAAFNNNPDIGRKAFGNLQRDERWVERLGATREDIQNARRIIWGEGNGVGWVDRLEKALKAGAVLPAVAAAIFAEANSQGRAGRPALPPNGS